MRRHGPRRAQIADDLDVDVVQQVLTDHLLDLAGGRHAAGNRGVVDQDVDAAQLAHGRGHQGVHRGVIASVDGHGDDASAGVARQLGRSGLERFGAARGDDHLDALLGQLPGDGLADAAASTGDDGALALQLQVHEPSRK